MTVSSINIRKNVISTDAINVNKLREIFPSFTAKEDKLKLYKILIESGNDIFCAKVPSFCNKLKKKESEYESLHLPLDKSKNSKQIF